MTIKVCKFTVTPGVEFPQFNRQDNTQTEDVTQLGQDGLTYFFAFDDANVTVQADSANQLKIYDFSNSDDTADLKTNVVALTYVTQKITEIEDKFMKSRNVYSVIKAVLDNDSAFAASLAECENEKTAFLQGLGLPGTSILS